MTPRQLLKVIEPLAWLVAILREAWNDYKVRRQRELEKAAHDAIDDDIDAVLDQRGWVRKPERHSAGDVRGGISGGAGDKKLPSDAGAGD